jgi:hypothetical protein
VLPAAGICAITQAGTRVRSGFASSGIEPFGSLATAASLRPGANRMGGFGRAEKPAETASRAAPGTRKSVETTVLACRRPGDDARQM